MAITNTREQTLNATLHYVSGLLRNNDPRAVLEALLVGASNIATITVQAGKFDHPKIAALFGQALVEALRPIEQEEKSPLLVPGK